MIAALICASLWVAIVVVPHVGGGLRWLDALENRLVDARYKILGPRAASPDIVIVAIDDAMLAAEGGATPTGRSLLAQLIRTISQSGARALAVDVLLAEEGDADEDAELAEALASLPSVIAAAAVFNATNDTSRLILPQPVFSRAAQTGLVNLSTDAAGTPRYAPLLIDIGGELRPALPLLAALSFTGQRASFAEASVAMGDRSVPLDQGYYMPLRLLGPSGSVTTLSASKLIRAPMPDLLSGKVVVLGFTASAMGDRFPTPFDASTPGVEIIATAISQLAGGPTLRRDAQVRVWDAVHAVALALLCVVAVMLLPLSRSLLLIFAMISLSMISLTITFNAGVWMSAALPLAAAIPPVLLMSAMRYAQERRQADRSERTVASLRRFQSPALAKKIEDDPEYLVVPVDQNLIVFFVDITGFTGISQKLGQGGTRQMLRRFHTTVSDAIETRGGSVLNFMGDGALAVFGLDAATSEHAADHALSAAFELARSLSEERLDGLPDERLGCRIGLHAGSVILSRMGVESHQQVTVTGDTVNLASRLMEVAKTENAVVVASSDFAGVLRSTLPGKSARQTDVPIRGRAGRVDVLVWDQDAIGPLIRIIDAWTPVKIT